MTYEKLCFSWLLYDAENYNVNNPELGSFTGWGEGYCVDFDGIFSQRASSARYVGAPNGYKYSTLSLFQFDGYSGNEQYFYEETPNVNYDNFGRSVIVTGCDAWTLYE